MWWPSVGRWQQPISLCWFSHTVIVFEVPPAGWTTTSFTVLVFQVLVVVFLLASPQRHYSSALQHLLTARLWLRAKCPMKWVSNKRMQLATNYDDAKGTPRSQARKTYRKGGGWSWQCARTCLLVMLTSSRCCGFVPELLFLVLFQIFGAKNMHDGKLKGQTKALRLSFAGLPCEMCRSRLAYRYLLFTLESSAAGVNNRWLHNSD